ncbi:hypothetical protein ACIHCM_34710 [Streptomyces sp. NPDC052023]|uniref:hypothetical protein n=1 Tax=Streptomyces sp. NPDC052023 TaxID=3365681 RepID=UPI0037D6909F
MPNNTATTPTTGPAQAALVKARRRIQTAHERGVTPSDGGSTGRTTATTDEGGDALSPLNEAAHLGQDERLAQMFHRHHGHVPAAVPDPGQLICWRDVNTILATHRLQPPRFRLSADREMLPAHRYTAPHGNAAISEWRSSHGVALLTAGVAWDAVPVPYAVLRPDFDRAITPQELAARLSDLKLAGLVFCDPYRPFVYASAYGTGSGRATSPRPGSSAWAAPSRTSTTWACPAGRMLRRRARTG